MDVTGRAAKELEFETGVTLTSCEEFLLAAVEPAGQGATEVQVRASRRAPS